MKEEMYLYLFELQGNGCDVGDFYFLDKLQTAKEIEAKIDFVVSRMILHEDEDSLCNIIEDFLLRIP